jgi:sulfiredoxin
MMKRQSFSIADIYVPAKRRATFNSKTVDEIAESILEVVLRTPILVRRDSAQFVLVEGLHRLEACRKLGETTIFDYLVDARQH